MQFKFKGDLPVNVAALNGLLVEPGEVIDVPDELVATDPESPWPALSWAESLWEPVKPAKAAKAAAENQE